MGNVPLENFFRGVKKNAFFVSRLDAVNNDIIDNAIVNRDTNFREYLD